MTHHMKTNDICLGDYVETVLGQRGRVYAMHYTCPEDAEWLDLQTYLKPEQKMEYGWASVLHYPAGAVVMPTSAMHVVEPFDMRDQRDYSFHWRD